MADTPANPATRAAPDSPASPVEHVLTLDCPEAPGIVHAVTRYLVDHGCDIADNQQFGDRRGGHFFMRVRFTSAAGRGDEIGFLRRDFSAVAAPFAMRWRLEPARSRRRVLIMVSRYGHCLNDLLFRVRSGDLPIDVVAGGCKHPPPPPGGLKKKTPPHHKQKKV
ncbi:ACT domain-containing protein [Streptomyces sp. NPDC057611]|uniref:ACT domain-containing protein n=1 Tax=Streptomyces sp. NPDC057611 TaxID=3346182 RepID=UPI003699FA63